MPNLLGKKCNIHAPAIIASVGLRKIMEGGGPITVTDISLVLILKNFRKGYVCQIDKLPKLK